MIASSHLYLRQHAPNICMMRVAHWAFHRRASDIASRLREFLIDAPCLVPGETEEKKHVTGMELGLLLWMLSTLTGITSAVLEQYRAVDWLSRYGYLPPPDPRTSRMQTKEGLEKAIRVMQRFGRIQETGVLDSETLKLMSTPRCSLPDIIGNEDRLRRRRRRKRYALSGLKWDKTDLTWSVHSYPSPSRSPGLSRDSGLLVDSILTRALKAWSDAAPLTFRQLQSDSGGAATEGDIRVTFARMLHDDGYPFDGQGGTLAHAFFPGRDVVAGDTHFDDDEIWSYGGDSGSTDLFTVAVHEFGHALGLSHSSSDPSIMRPYYQGAVGDVAKFQLAIDDKLAIQRIYGVSDGGSTGGVDPDLPRLPSPPRPTQASDPSFNERCEGGFDAVANIRGEVFFFKGNRFWRTTRLRYLVSLNPALIRNFWIGLPLGTNKVDAVYERKSDNSIIFFIGPQYWVFKDTVALSDYPRPLSDWGMKTKSGGAVERVDAAFVWAHNGKTYLFSGGEFWRFDESPKDQKGTMQPEQGYPGTTASGGECRLTWMTSSAGEKKREIYTYCSCSLGDAYFFKDNLYWVLKKGGLNQEVVMSKSIAVDWLRCPAPPVTSTPRIPKECSCDLKGSSSFLRSSWLLLISAVLIIHC
ncbi:hypothetical protein NQZ68_031762 [Dissostichus eleginoides]|nr:hypothetical protein NQZ68_031762 [Dissostichus eleginoides]